jgi:hypothetical protein
MKPGHDDHVSYLRICAAEAREDDRGDDYRAQKLLNAANEIERLRRTRDELLAYINGIARNSAKVVETMQDATV